MPTIAELTGFELSQVRVAPNYVCKECGADWMDDELLAAADQNEDLVASWIACGLCPECDPGFHEM